MESYQHAGLRFDVDDRGPADGPVVVLLHGWPQTRESWTPVADRLVAAGYRVLAPDQRGYSPGARPRGRGQYTVPKLVGDVAALIREAGGGPVHVVGHDWGAVVAWALAAAHPGLVASVTGVSVPHPMAFLRSLGRSRQAALSWYMAVFQLPLLPERLLARPGVLAAVLRRTGQSPTCAHRDVAALAARGELRAVLRATLNWYRGLPLSDPRPGRDPSTRAVEVPALLVWSSGDVAISRAAVEGNAALMTGPYRMEVLPGVSHWIPDELPDRLAALVLDHVASAVR